MKVRLLKKVRKRFEYKFKGGTILYKDNKTGEYDIIYNNELFIFIWVMVFRLGYRNLANRLNDKHRNNKFKAEYEAA